MSMRYARIDVPANKSGEAFAETVARYLPRGYRVAAIVGSDDTGMPRPVVVIAGEDNAGWTMDDYVLPRLASGFIFGREVHGDMDSIVSAIVSELNAMSAVAVTPGTREWCAKRNHPWITYNPWLDRTYCRCGERQEAGEQPMDWDAKWEVFHDHPRGAPCRCHLPKDATQAITS